jgi:hypothetical protein
VSGKDTPPYTPGGEDEHMRTSWMSEASSNPNSTHTSPRFSGRPLPSRSNSSTQGVFSSPSITTSAAASTHSSTVPPSPSLYEERGRTLTRANPHPIPHHYNHFDPSLSTIHGSPSTNGAFLTTHPSMHAHAVGQGSHVSFDPQEEVYGEEEPRASRVRTSSSRSRPPPPSRRSTSVVFLSVGALVTFGGGMFSGGGVGTMDVQRGGRAWSSSGAEGALPAPAATSRLRHPSFFSPPSPSSPLALVLPASPHSRRSVIPVELSSSSSTESFAHPPPKDDDGDEDDEPLPHGPDWERIIGRASAWVCTTAYLTSRLPQLWQNVRPSFVSSSSFSSILTLFPPFQFRRRSCEGLAMTLFLFAFIGNTLYVLSILTNPLASSSPGYLLESTPYLLGSGGTLCFDLAILFQSVIYSERYKARRERRERRRTAGGLEAEEEAALLFDGDGEGGRTSTDDYGDNDTLRAARKSGRRSTASGGGGGGGSSRNSSRGYSVSRSVSTGGRSRVIRPPSTRRTTSNSTEMDRRPVSRNGSSTTLDRKGSESSLSRPPSSTRGLSFEDRSFEFGTGGRGVSRGRNEGGSGTSTPAGGSRDVSRARTSTTGGSSFAEASIPEEGESRITLRGD